MSRPTGRPASVDTHTIAVAMEMRSDGICWKLIERHLATEPGLRFVVAHAKRHGAAPYAKRDDATGQRVISNY